MGWPVGLGGRGGVLAKIGVQYYGKTKLQAFEILLILGHGLKWFYLHGYINYFFTRQPSLSYLYRKWNYRQLDQQFCPQKSFVFIKNSHWQKGLSTFQIWLLEEIKASHGKQKSLKCCKEPKSMNQQEIPAVVYQGKLEKKNLTWERGEGGLTIFGNTLTWNTVLYAENESNLT